MPFVRDCKLPGRSVTKIRPLPAGGGMHRVGDNVVMAVVTVTVRDYLIVPTITIPVVERNNTTSSDGCRCQNDRR